MPERQVRQAAAKSAHVSAPVPLTIRFDPLQIAWVLAGLVLLIVIAGFIANVIIYNVAPSTDHPAALLMKRLDLGHEPSLPNWYSSIALLVASMLLALVAYVEKAAATVDATRWIVLSLLFLLLAADEAILIHEMFDRPTQELLNTSGFLLVAWVLPYSVFVAIAGLYFLPFLRRLDTSTRRLFVISGVMFLSGAMGIEMIEGLLIDLYGVHAGFASLRLTIVQTIAEALEMFAIVLFIYGILEYLRRRVGRLTLICHAAGRQRHTTAARSATAGIAESD